MPAKTWLAAIAMALLPALCLGSGLRTMLAPFENTITPNQTYDCTVDAGAAKLAYLTIENQEYDSYLIGTSAAAYDIETLNRHYNARFYDLSADSFDEADPRALVPYLINHYRVKHIFLNLGAGETATAAEQVDLTDLTGEARATWLRDIEKVGDPAAYRAAHEADFTLPAAKTSYRQVPVEDIAAIRDLCARRGVKLTVVCPPIYEAQWKCYDETSLRGYRTALAQVVDYWDFSGSMISGDSRYFYDASHFRSAVGNMMLAEIFDDETVWRPEGFGTLVTKANCQSHLDKLFSQPAAAAADTYTRDVPILLYHHVVEDAAQAKGASIVSAATFEAHMKAISEAGYTTVSFQEMIDYVYHGGTLPEKSVCITFDDGYSSNYELAWPILQKYGMKATVFTIGSSVGDSMYKDTEHAITPHFSYDEAREMLASGQIDIQSHTYDMHQWSDGEAGEVFRRSVLPVAGETDAAFAAVLQADLAQYEAIRTTELGSGFCALAYPNGHYNELAERVIHEAGIPVTVSTKTDCRNILIRGLPQSLYALCRQNVTETMSIEKLLGYLD